MSSVNAQGHYPVYDSNQNVIVTRASEPDSADDIKTSVYILLPEKHHWVKVPAHPDNKVIPINKSRYFNSRWNFIEHYNVYVYVDKINHDVYLYKLSADKKDTDAPIIDFEIPLTGLSKHIPITTFDARDDHLWSVKYAITESAVPPGLDSEKWQKEPPVAYRTRSGSGPLTLYAYAMDMFGNISEPVSGTITLDVDDHSPGNFQFYNACTIFFTAY